MDISLKLALSIFGLNEKYSQSEINSAYRRLAKITHPDTGGDNNLFLFIKECKEVLEKNIPDSTFSSQNVSKANHTHANNAQKLADIELDILYEEYNVLEEYMKDFNIRAIISNMYISINPIFKKSLTKWKNCTLEYPFKSFVESNLREIVFEECINIPIEFEKYNFFKVFIKIDETKYHFFISRNAFKEFSSLTAFKKNAISDCFLTTIRLSFKNPTL